MKTLHISFCALMVLALSAQSAQAMITQDQISAHAMIARDQIKDYIQSHPNPTMIKSAAGAAAGITAATALHLYNKNAYQSIRGIALPNSYKGNILGQNIIEPKLTNGNHKDCLTQLPKVFDTDDYRYLIEDGARIFNHIKNNPHAIYQIDTKDIVQLSWFLYSLTMYKDQDFTRGVTVIEDNGTIFQFLLNYVNQVNRDPKPSLWNLWGRISLNPYAYPRVSTHFPQSKTSQYGIDIRLDESGNRHAVLLGGQTSILFGKIDKDTFIKYERDGLYLWDGWFQHTLTAITALGRKLPIFGRLFGSNDYDGSRKEHMPSDIKKEAAKLELNNRTISALNDACQRNQRKYAGLIKIINQKYPFLNDEEKRFGNEAIITKQDLKLAEYYNPEILLDYKVDDLRSIVEDYQKTLAQSKQAQS